MNPIVETNAQWLKVFYCWAVCNDLEWNLNAGQTGSLHYYIADYCSKNHDHFANRLVVSLAQRVRNGTGISLIFTEAEAEQLKRILESYL